MADMTDLAQRVAFANRNLHACPKHVLRANAVFAFVDRPVPAWGDAGPVNES
jgi:hypothetical protein